MSSSPTRYNATPRSTAAHNTIARQHRHQGTGTVNATGAVSERAATIRRGCCDSRHAPARLARGLWRAGGRRLTGPPPLLLEESESISNVEDGLPLRCCQCSDVWLRSSPSPMLRCCARNGSGSGGMKGSSDEEGRSDGEPLRELRSTSLPLKSASLEPMSLRPC
jgi:hypothetical protein